MNYTDVLSTATFYTLSSLITGWLSYMALRSENLIVAILTIIACTVCIVVGLRDVKKLLELKDNDKGE